MKGEKRGGGGDEINRRREGKGTRNFFNPVFTCKIAVRLREAVYMIH